MLLKKVHEKKIHLDRRDCFESDVPGTTAHREMPSAGYVLMSGSSGLDTSSDIFVPVFQGKSFVFLLYCILLYFSLAFSPS